MLRAFYDTRTIPAVSLSCNGPPQKEVSMKTSGTILSRTLMFFIGLVVAVPALNTLHTYFSYRLHGKLAYGIIDHPSASRDIGGRPLVEYTDSSGTRHEFKTRAKTHWFVNPQKGEEVRIYISGDDPGQAIADNLFHYVFLPLLLLGTSCCCWQYAIFDKSTDRNTDNDSPNNAIPTDSR